MEEEDHWPLNEPKFKGKKASPCCVIATVLGVLFVAALVVVAGLSAGLALKKSTSTVIPSNASNGSNTSTCLTRECVELGNQILSSLDQSIDPCDNFYKFACNRFLNRTIMPYGTTSTGSAESLLGGNQERFRSLMESGNNRSVAAIQKAITYYNSCIDKDGVKKQSLPALNRLLEDLGGWPLVGLDETRDWDINDPDGLLMEKLYGSGAFFTFAAYPDPFNSSANILGVSQGGLTLPSSDVYQPGPLRDLLKAAMVSVFQAIEMNMTDEDMIDDEYGSAADEILEFESAIANFTDFSFLRKPFVDQINITTWDVLAGYMPNFTWAENMKSYGKMWGFEVNTSAPVNVLGPARFFVELNDLITSTDNITLRNYAKWHLMYALLPALNQDFSDIHYSINKLLTGDEEPPRYKTCVDNIQQQIPLALARAFTDEFFPPEAQSNMTVVLKELKAALKDRISKKDWLDNSTKQHALDKAETINEFVAYPSIIKNTSFLNKFYSRLNISASQSYLDNYLNASKFSSLMMFAALGHANNRSEWNLGLPFPPTFVNAAYYPNGNQIYILEGILNIPFFKSYWPDYFKFGTIGFVVGHEFFHGFDNAGRRFDQYGNMVNWWSQSSLDAFNNRSKCLIDQYDQYRLPAGRLNGTLTLGENIADNGGLGIAFQAYKSRANKTRTKMQQLPGLKYSADQLFFIGTTQSWCQIASEEKQVQLLQDVHTPSPLRPRGFLSNSVDFASAFQCPKGSRMNPTHKCELW